MTEFKSIYESLWVMNYFLLRYLYLQGQNGDSLSLLYQNFHDG